MTLAVSVEHNNARLEGPGTVPFADAGPLNSRIHFYDASDTLLVTMVLDKPCGAIVDDVLVLAQLDPVGDMVAVTGSAVTGVWVNGNDVLVGAGTVSDEAGSGDFKISGTTGTMLYAGARAILGVTALT